MRWSSFISNTCLPLFPLPATRSKALPASPWSQVKKRTVTFRLSPRQLAVFDEDGRCLVEPGVVEIFRGREPAGSPEPGAHRGETPLHPR